MFHLRKVGRGSRLVSCRSFSGLTEISGIFNEPSTWDQSASEKVETGTKVKNKRNICQSMQDAIEDSKALEYRMRQMPYMPQNPCQSLRNKVFIESLQRTQGSGMSNYELICRGEFEDSRRIVNEYYFMQAPSNSFNSINSINPTKPSNSRLQWMNRMDSNSMDTFDTYDTYDTYDTNDTYDTMSHTLAKSVDVSDENNNNNNNNNGNKSHVKDKAKSVELDSDGALCTSEGRQHPAAVVADDAFINEETEEEVELSNYSNVTLPHGQMNDLYECRNDVKWRKLKMKKHQKRKRIKRDRLKKVPGNQPNKRKPWMA